MLNRCWLRTASLLSAWILTNAGLGCFGPEGPKPNVLLITVDTLRADRLGAYGFQLATSPAIDRLAAQGVLFERAISGASFTAGSHASIMASRYTREHTIGYNNGGTKLEGATTLAEIFGQTCPGRAVVLTEHKSNLAGTGNNLTHRRDKVLAARFRAVVEDVPRTIRSVKIENRSLCEGIRATTVRVSAIWLQLGRAAFVGSASIEAELRDARTGIVLAQAVDSRIGGKSLSGATAFWADAQEAFDFWAQAMAKVIERQAGGAR